MRNPFEVYTSVTRGKNPRPLDWEESALDSQSYVEGFFDDDRTPPGLAWLWAILIVTFLIVGGKVFYLQVIKGPGFRVLSDNNRIRSQTILAPRGLIKDRYGDVLAQNTASFNLVAIPTDLPKTGWEDELRTLGQTFGFDPADAISRLSNIGRGSFEPVIIKQDLSGEQSILFETNASKFIGFSVQKIPIREYLEPQVFSHALGYPGLISASELQQVDRKQYDTADFIGKTGIEAQYEKFLHGTNGENLIEVDATGKLLDVIGENSPKPGNTLILNIDKGLQETLYKGFKEGTKGAAVAIDPRNGEVLALVSVPGFDNNQFAHGIKQDEYQSLLSDKSLPLFNRSISGTYPPGSTVKPVVATAALQEGVITEKTVVNDRGVLVVPNQYNPSISYDFHGWKPGGLGPVTVRSAIALSSDIFFYATAGGAPNTQIKDGLGAQRLADWYKKFNLGQATGIDLQGEKPGVVPDPAWKAKAFASDPIMSKWYLGDTYHIGIGQGDLLVTPLQVAEWTAAIANGGTNFKPQLANKVIDSNGNTIWENKPQVLVNRVADDSVVKIVREGMRETVLSGTARPLNTLPISSAGKTGTSQFDGADPSRTHAWFTSFAPYEQPHIVITVLVEAGGEGNEAAEPIVKEALQWWAENRYGK